MIKRTESLLLLAQIIEAVEDVMVDKGVVFPDTEELMRAAGYSEEEIKDNGAVFYGENYYEVEDAIAQVLIDWEIMEG